VLDVFAARVHVVLLNVPPLPPSLHDSIPVGAVFVPLPVSATVAVNVSGLPTVTDAGLGETLVLVVRALQVGVV
jgi:hypothetical protein